MSRSSSTRRATPRPVARSAPASRTTVPAGIIAALTILCGVALTGLFWWPLWTGGGLIGGDLYPYYFPQKIALAESLKAGEWPFWNPWVGFGYPILGESQTGAFSPINLLLYRIASVNTAYNLIQLGHYVLAFCGAVGLSRRCGLRLPGALLAALVVVYGWFPARICLEWAIIGGAWFFCILWRAAVFLQTGRALSLLAVGVCLGLDLLAGHYNLAFITLLALPALFWLLPESPPAAGKLTGSEESAPDFAGNASCVKSPFWRCLRWAPGRVLMLGAVVLTGFLIAGIQLLPTWELKQVSQRQQVSDVFAPTYGHLPIRALSQLWMPWAWYAGERTMDQMLGGDAWSVPTPTNQAEAQFYLGLLPLALAVLALGLPRLRCQLTIQAPWGWLILILLSLLFASGWPTAWLSFLPGIGFFRGPGRYSLVAAWGIAMLAGAGWEAVLRRLQLSSKAVIVSTGLLALLTAGDLWAASRQYQFFNGPYLGRQVFYATLLDTPPIHFLHESGLRKFFEQAGPHCRLYAPGQNIPSMLHVSALPVYLGLGPEIYESPEMRIQFSKTPPAEIPHVVTRLKQWGVTHLLLESPVDAEAWSLRFQGQVLDPFLNRALARPEPYYFYELVDSLGRFSVTGSGNPTISTAMIHPNQATFTVTAPEGGTLILRDLDYPGWKPDGEHSLKSGEKLTAGSAAQETGSSLFRTVTLPASASPQTVTWTYRPASVFWGAGCSLCGMVILVMITLFWARQEHAK